jgi:hypothetical protein
MEDFKKALEEAVNASAQKHQIAANHVIRQAFYDGVRFYLNYMSPKPPLKLVDTTPP